MFLLLCEMKTSFVRRIEENLLQQLEKNSRNELFLCQFFSSLLQLSFISFILYVNNVFQKRRHRKSCFLTTSHFSSVLKSFQFIITRRILLFLYLFNGFQTNMIKIVSFFIVFEIFPRKFQVLVTYAQNGFEMNSKFACYVCEL